MFKTKVILTKGDKIDVYEESTPKLACDTFTMLCVLGVVLLVLSLIF